MAEIYNHFIPHGLVVRICRSHRQGRGSIPREGGSFVLFYFYAFYYFMFMHFMHRGTSYQQGFGPQKTATLH